MHTPRRKPFLYIPGLLSLALLTSLCLWYLYHQKVFHRYYALELVYPDSSYAKWLPTRQYIDINLSGNAKEAKKNLALAQSAMHQMVLRKDTLKGIHILFSDGMNYATFVEAHNTCQMEKVNYYPYENGIWVWVYKRENREGQTINLGNCVMFCGTRSANRINSQADQKLTPMISSSIKSYWPVEVLFMILLFTSIRRVIQYKPGGS